MAILREKTKVMFGRTKELVKAGATRFGTHTLVGERLLELKAVLQQTVVDTEYMSQGYADRADEQEHTNAEVTIRQHKGGTAKKLVLGDEEGGFWARVSEHVSTTMPLYKFLRRHDSSAPSVGKVFYGWFEIGNHLKESKASYQPTLVEKHAERWDYGDVPFFTAAYVLDPEFVDHQQSDDEHVMSGFMDTVEKVGVLMYVRKHIESFKEPWIKRREFIAADPAQNQRKWDKYPCYPDEKDPFVKEFCSRVSSQLALYRCKKGVFARAWVFDAAAKMPAYLWWDQYGSSV